MFLSEGNCLWLASSMDNDTQTGTITANSVVTSDRSYQLLPMAGFEYGFPILRFPKPARHQ